MGWTTVIGQERAKEILRRSMSEARLAHAYLFWGPRGTGKDALAIAFAQALLCERGGVDACGECPNCRRVVALSHPNVRLIYALPASRNGKGEEEGGEKLKEETGAEIRRQMDLKAHDPYFHIAIPKASMITIGSIREIRRESALASYERGRKVFIISDADLMNDAASNALLKVLEEPLPDTIFVLTTSRRERLLPTIVSRCQSIRFETLGDDEIEQGLKEREGVVDASARLAARLAVGDYGKAKELLEDDVVLRRKHAVGFLRSLLGGNVPEMFGAIEDTSAGNNRIAVEQSLHLLLAWFRDALMIRESAAGGIINEDFRPELERFVKRFGTMDLEGSLAAVERSLELLRRNVYLPLVLLSLSAQLRLNLVHARTP